MGKKSFTISHLLNFFIPALIFLIISGCSTTSQETYTIPGKNSRAEQTFSFYKTENGKDVRWEVNFDKGEISSVFKDGQRVPDNEIDNYREMIYDKLNMLRDKSHHIVIDLSDFKMDMKKFKEDMKKMKKELKDKKFEFNFDNEDFKEGMKELSKELSKLKNKKIEIEFDTDKFKDEMEELKKDIDIDIHINKDDIRKNLDELNEEIQKHKDELKHIEIDLSGLDDIMSEIGKNSWKIKVNLHGLDAKLKKLTGFIDELKDEMIKDNLIKNKDEKLNLDLYENGMKVNGKKVKPELFEKYKKMYRDYFDKNLSGENHFRIVE
jgi:chromosome segregation ATPase